MLINSIDNSIFRTRDFIEGAKLWNELYSRYKYFSIESIMHYSGKVKTIMLNKLMKDL